jgi:TPR repeat protein
MLAHGRGTPADPARAAAAMKQACDAVAPASRGLMLEPCVALDVMKLEGVGVPKDPAAAIASLESMCSPTFKLISACQALAAAYLDGTGVPADPEKARRFGAQCERFLGPDLDPALCGRLDALGR